MQPKTATALQALSMAQNLLDSGLSAEMISFLKTHIDDYKENISYLLRAGQLAMNAENFDLALEHFRAIPSGAPSTVTTLVSQWKALCLYCADFASTDAILLFEKYHFLDDTGYLSKLAFHFESNWLHDKLYFSGRDISLSKDWQAKSSKKLGHYIEHGQWQSVYDCLSQQTAINDETHFYLAGTCEMLGDYTSCCKHLDLISPEIQEQHSVKACRGRALIRQRQFSEGVRIIKDIPMQGPEDFGLCYYWGIISLAYGQEENALVFFNRAFSDYRIDTNANMEPQIRREILSL